MLLRNTLSLARLRNLEQPGFPTQVPAVLERFDFHAGVDDDAPMNTTRHDPVVALNIKPDPYTEH